MQYNEISLTIFHACIFIIAEPEFSGLFLTGGILIPGWSPAKGQDIYRLQMRSGLCHHPGHVPRIILSFSCKSLFISLLLNPLLCIKPINCEPNFSLISK